MLRTRAFWLRISIDRSCLRTTVEPSNKVLILSHKSTSSGVISAGLAQRRSSLHGRRAVEVDFKDIASKSTHYSQWMTSMSKNLKRY